MNFVRNIPLAEIRPGDYFDALIECKKSIYDDKRPIIRRCQLVAIHPPNILIVRTATRKDVVPITRNRITSEFAWGER